MPEAEDVILDAAERVSAAARDLWRRHRPPPAPDDAAFDALRGRLAILLTACFGGEWSILPADAPLAPGWLARHVGAVAPWDVAPRAVPYTDGVRIWLPRRPGTGDAVNDCNLLRVMSLVMGARLARGSIEHCPTDGAARDLYWAAEGAIAERILAAELPGIRSAIASARRLALDERSAATTLRAPERASERLVARLLDGSVGNALGELGLAPAHTPAAVAAWARQTARDAVATSTYRGLAPVRHWGCARPDLVAAAGQECAAAATGGSRSAQGPLHSRRLARQLRGRRSDAESPAGPFLLPFGDPQQTVEDAAGLRRPKDQGQDLDLDALSENLARLAELPRVRADDAVREILENEDTDPPRSVVTSAPNAPQSGALLYPEWNWRTGSYRAAYCLVREATASAGDPAWAGRTLDEHRALLHQVRRRFESLRPRRRRYMRQLDGVELDLDACVDDFADRAAGCSPGERLYADERPARRDVAVAVLLDASGSTDAWVSGGRRVLDIEKEAALIFCEAMERLGDRYAMHAFSGSRARRVHVWRVKGFAETYGASIQARIAGLAGEAFTRLGAPLRHVSAELVRQPAHVRLLLLLSDGKPNDEDEYDGRYGIEDTRQAVVEARLQGVQVFCLAVRREPGSDLARIFGPTGYAVLADVRELPARLPEVYRRLTRLSP